MINLLFVLMNYEKEFMDRGFWAKNGHCRRDL